MPARRSPLAVRRVVTNLLCLLMLVLTPLAAPAAAWAGAMPAPSSVPQVSAFEQGPASSDQLALYARIASVNTCIATRSGQEFEQAAGVAGETIAQLILGVHKGLIASSGASPLSLEELRKGSINAAVIGATEICPKQVPDDLTAKVRQALAGSEAQPMRADQG
jgi:hypothetical protein